MNGKSVRWITATMLTAGISMLIGCSNEKTDGATASASPSVINSTCPFSGKPVAKDVTVAYKDKAVGFCCKGCESEWAKMSDADRAAKVATMTAK